MKFSDKELGYVLRAGYEMTKADGHILPSELEVLFRSLPGVTFGSARARALAGYADTIAHDEMVDGIRAFDIEKKRFVSAYLATIMISDGHADDSELTLWRTMTATCGLPQSTIREAVTFWVNH